MSPSVGERSCDDDPFGPQEALRALSNDAYGDQGCHYESERYNTTGCSRSGWCPSISSLMRASFTDRLLAKFSTSPYGKSDLEYMLNVVKEIEEGMAQGGGSPSCPEHMFIIRL